MSTPDKYQIDGWKQKGSKQDSTTVQVHIVLVANYLPGVVCFRVQVLSLYNGCRRASPQYLTNFH